MSYKLGNKIISALLILLCLVSIVSIALYEVTRFSVKVFGELPLSQVLFHLKFSGGVGALTELIRLELIKRVIYVLVSSLFLLFLLLLCINDGFKKNTVKAIRKSIKKLLSLVCALYRFSVKNLFTLKFLYFSLLCFVSVFGLKYVDEKFNIFNAIDAKNSVWFENHYASIDQFNVKFKDNNKRNLIYIFLESMEKDYRNKDIYSENLIPELTEIEKEGLVFAGYRKTPGAFFTLDGISAQLLGIPIITHRMDINNFNGDYNPILHKTPSIFNILKNNGYNTANFSGVSGRFTKKSEFFSTHGISDLHFSETWIERGFKLNKESQGAWEFNDVFLWKRLTEWLNDSKNTNTPFAVVFETVDTHFPEGWLPNEYKKHNDIRDAIKFASKTTNEFIEWAKKQSWYENTIIVIVGDHPWQDPPKSSFTKMTTSSSNREIYNVILNAPNIPKGTIIAPEGGFTAMDMAPTVLSIMGVEFTSAMIDGSTSNNKIGLGTNLLSKEKTIVSKEGIKPYYDELLNKTSSLYEKMFW